MRGSGQAERVAGKDGQTTGVQGFGFQRNSYLDYKDICNDRGLLWGKKKLSLRRAEIPRWDLDSHVGIRPLINGDFQFLILEERTSYR